MNIALTGVGCNNKGAELMLCAMVQHLRREFPKSKIVCGYSGGYDDRVRYGLRQLADRGVSRLSRILEYLPKKTRDEWGFILPKEIDVVLDASGFAFGDQWSESYVQGNCNRNLKFKNAKIILLPQALGPFEKVENRKNCFELFSRADLIFPRDKQSFKYVADVLSSDEKLYLAPDFTNLVQGFVPHSFDTKWNGAIGILPNEKMIANKSEEQKRIYISFLVHCIAILRKRNIPHFIVAHQNEDHKVIELIQAELGSLPFVSSEKDPIFIKGILGMCRFLIGSRFHGLVNGLSQGVPCICTSWSHKYEALFEDYRCSEYIVSDLSQTGSVDDLIAKLLDNSIYQKVCCQVKECAENIKVDARNMWEQVDTFLHETLSP